MVVRGIPRRGCGRLRDRFPGLFNLCQWFDSRVRACRLGIRHRRLESRRGWPAKVVRWARKFNSPAPPDGLRVDIASLALRAASGQSICLRSTRLRPKRLRSLGVLRCRAAERPVSPVIGLKLSAERENDNCMRAPRGDRGCGGLEQVDDGG